MHVQYLAWILYVLTFICLDLTYGASSIAKRKAHKLKTLRSDGLKKVCRNKETDNFKRDYLQPFLRERVSDTDGNRAVQKHINDTMKQLGWTVELDTFVDSTPFGDKTFTNIIAVHNPAATRRLTVACHFDSKYFKEFQFIGATDSAVPCALMIETAQRLNSALANSADNDLTLQFIFFDGEEAFVDWTDTDSLYGSRHLAKKMATEFIEVKSGEPVTELEAIEVFILLDLIGTADVTFTNWFSETEKLYERLQKIEMKLAKEALLEPVDMFKSRQTNKYFKGNLVRQGGGISDDHIPFLKQSVPVLHLISSPFPSVWHTEKDNEAALHYPTIKNIGRILRCFIIEYLNLSV